MGLNRARGEDDMRCVEIIGEQAWHASPSRFDNPGADFSEVVEALIFRVRTLFH